MQRFRTNCTSDYINRLASIYLIPFYLFTAQPIDGGGVVHPPGPPRARLPASRHGGLLRVPALHVCVPPPAMRVHPRVLSVCVCVCTAVPRGVCPGVGDTAMHVYVHRCVCTRVPARTRVRLRQRVRAHPCTNTPAFARRHRAGGGGWLCQLLSSHPGGDMRTRGPSRVPRGTTALQGPGWERGGGGEGGKFLWGRHRTHSGCPMSPQHGGGTLSSHPDTPLPRG